MGGRGLFFLFFGRGQWGGRGDGKEREGMCFLFVSVSRGRVTTAAITLKAREFLLFGSLGWAALERSGTHGRIYLCVVLTLNM